MNHSRTDRQEHRNLHDEHPTIPIVANSSLYVVAANKAEWHPPLGGRLARWHWVGPAQRTRKSLVSAAWGSCGWSSILGIDIEGIDGKGWGRPEERF